LKKWKILMFSFIFWKKKFVIFIILKKVESKKKIAILSKIFSMVKILKNEGMWKCSNFA
jgi:hypothetical protein